MQDLQALISANAPAALLCGGLLIGLLFGILARATGFCTLGGISDWLNFSDSRRLRSWALAAGIAITGAALLEAAAVTDLSRSIYQSPNLDWSGALLGGSLFGIGMALAGGCTSSNLVRAGAGDLRAFFTILAIGLFAGMAAGGLLAPARAALATATMMPLSAPRQSLGDLLAAPLHLSSTAARLSTGVLFGFLVIGLALASAPFRQSRRHLIAGLGLGAAVVAAWALTGLAYDEMALDPQRPQALSFVKPSTDLIEWLQRSTAQGLPSFAVATVIGVLAGSCLHATATRTFRIATLALAVGPPRRRNPPAESRWRRSARGVRGPAG